MGSTPRQKVTQLPLPTRSSEASAECWGRVVLSYLREDEQAPATFFMLGDLLHRRIESAIITGEGLDEALALGKEEILGWLDEEFKHHVIESSKRGFDTMLDDYERMLTNWFTFVHPDSDKRHPVYDDYQWPPAVEVRFERTARSTGTRWPIWGSVDALFEHKHDGGYMIVDWKSGVKKPDSDFQLNFYRYGMGLFDAPAHYHLLDRVRKSSIVVEAGVFPGIPEIKKQIDLTERYKGATLKGYMPRFQPDWYCGYCPVQHLCPADGDPRDRRRNEKTLRKLLQTVEAMPVIEGE